MVGGGCGAATVDAWGLLTSPLEGGRDKLGKREGLSEGGGEGLEGFF